MENVENIDNAKKRITLSSLIIVISIIIIGISASYAYYLNVVQEVHPENQGTSVTSGELTMNFATTQYINATAASLTNDADILSNNDYTSFSITLPADSAADTASFSLYLTDIKMTQNFRSAYVKWALYTDTAEDEPKQVATGNFGDVTLSSTENSEGTYDATANLTLSENLSIAKGETNSYKLYIWLSNDPDNNQIDLLNGKLSTRVGFRART